MIAKAPARPGAVKLWSIEFRPCHRWGMEQVEKRSIVLGLCCSLVCSPVWAKTFVGVLYPLFGPMAAIGLVELASELRSMPDVEVATYLHQSWKYLVDDINRQPKGTHILIVGYSLGANNAVLVANRAHCSVVMHARSSWFGIGALNSLPMSALGQKRAKCQVMGMPTLHQKADMRL